MATVNYLARKRRGATIFDRTSHVRTNSRTVGSGGAAPASTIAQRKTLSALGTRVGKKQIQAS